MSRTQRNGASAKKLILRASETGHCAWFAFLDRRQCWSNSARASARKQISREVRIGSHAGELRTSKRVPCAPESGRSNGLCRLRLRAKTGNPDLD
jgi:hypothetical protein